jgi:glycerol-3-phosphate dehydrogenase (NAD(P)+)
MDPRRAHEIARERGPIPVVYWIVRAILQPFFHVYFRLRRHGLDHIPSDGPVLVAANHRSFSDPFLIGTCLRRPLHFVAKVELFDKRWKAWILLALGAFPIRRGESDEDAMETARIILERGGAVGIFPEGTRVRPGPLGEPRSGAGRLALETGAPLVPAAIIGTEGIRRPKWLIRPRRVTVRCGSAMTFPRPVEGTASEDLAREVTRRVWSCISLQWEWLGGTPPLRHAVVVGAGSWGTAVATLLARGGVNVQLACRTPEQAAELRADRTNLRYLPGVELPEAIEPVTVAEADLAGAELLCLAVPARALPSAVEGLPARLPRDLGVLVLTKGLVGPGGELPSRFVQRTSGSRPVACLGGPGHALEAAQVGATLVVGADDRSFAALVSSAFRAGGIDCEVSSDRVGVELAGIAKNAAALAAAAALPGGANAAGAAAGRIYSECHALGRRYGARHETFTGPAGAGDLVATVLAATSRNRRAGEMLAGGLHPDEIHERLGQVPEGLGLVPALARAMDGEGIRAPATHELAAVIEGRMPAERWIARSGRSRRPAKAA